MVVRTLNEHRRFGQSMRAMLEVVTNVCFANAMVIGRWSWYSSTVKRGNFFATVGFLLSLRLGEKFYQKP